MALLKYIERMKRMDRLIRMKATGSPNQFAEKMGLCKSVLLDHIKEMKNMGAPIEFDRNLNSYVYGKNVKLSINYILQDSESIKGGFSLNFFFDPNITDW